MHGFFFIDKPEGKTSFYCVKVLRRLTLVKSIGFLGTLDPLATGLLLFATGEATKLISYLEGMDKVYEVTIYLGAVSTTYDREGHVKETVNPKKPTRRKILQMLKDDFWGERMQVPPIFSAIQIEGKRAYDLARKGKEIHLKSRKVHFYDLQIRSYVWPLLKIMTHVSSGTYIRSFAHDLGQKLDCGGFVQELRRTKIGPYSVQDAVSLNDLTPLNIRSHFVPPDILLKNWSKMELTDKEYDILSHGNFIPNRPAYPGGPILALHNNRLTGVLEVHGSGKLKFQRKFNTV